MILKNIEETSKLLSWSRQPKYQYGFCLCANIYLGIHAAAYLSSNIKRIEKAACTKVKAYGTHIIRHTCASLYLY